MFHSNHIKSLILRFFSVILLSLRLEYGNVFVALLHCHQFLFSIPCMTLLLTFGMISLLDIRDAAKGDQEKAPAGDKRHTLWIAVVMPVLNFRTPRRDPIAINE